MARRRNVPRASAPVKSHVGYSINAARKAISIPMNNPTQYKSRFVKPTRNRAPKTVLPALSAPKEQSGLQQLFELSGSAPTPTPETQPRHSHARGFIFKILSAIRTPLFTIGDHPS